MPNGNSNPLAAELLIDEIRSAADARVRTDEGWTDYLLTADQGVTESGWSSVISPPVEPPRPQAGDRVVIPRGARITSSNPRRRHYIAQRRQVVRASVSSYGGSVTWAGMGGYYCWTTDWHWPDGEPAAANDLEATARPLSDQGQSGSVTSDFPDVPPPAGRLSFYTALRRLERGRQLSGDYTDYLPSDWRYCANCDATYSMSLASEQNLTSRLSYECPQCEACCCNSCVPGARWASLPDRNNTSTQPADDSPLSSARRREHRWAEEVVAPRDVLHSFDYRPDRLWFWTGEKRRLVPSPKAPYLGVELEMECPDSSTIRRVAEITEDAHHKKWWVKRDGSLGRYGVELVSHPATYDAHHSVMNWGELLGELQSMGCRSWDTDTCGLHVHVARDSMKESGWWRIGRLLHSNQRAVCRVVGRQSDYARWDMEQVNDAIFNKADLYRLDRYQAMNLTNETTVEFRIFRGTLVPSTFYAAMEMVLALRDYCGGLRFSECQSGALEWSRFTRWAREKEDAFPNFIDRLSRIGISSSPIRQYR